MAGRGDEGVVWLRSQRAHLLSRERLISLEAALGPIFAALDLLDLLPEHLKARFPASSWSKLTQTEPSEAAKAYLLGSGWFIDAQRQLVEQVIVDWTDDLAASGRESSAARSTLQDKLLRAVFRPDVPGPTLTSSGGAAGLINLIEEVQDNSASREDAASEQLAMTGRIIACGISATSQILRSRAEVQEDGSISSSVHPLTLKASSFVLSLLVIYDEKSQPSPVEAMLTAALHMQNPAQRQKFWTDAIKGLCAVPARVSNVFGRDDIPKALHDPSFFALIAAQFEGLVFRMSYENDDHSSSTQLVLIKELFEKLVRSGVTSRALEGALTGTPSHNQVDFLGALLQAVLKRTQQTQTGKSFIWVASYRKGWNRLLQSLDSFDSGVRFLRHLIAYLDHRSFVSRQLSDLVTFSEQSRAGTEGQAFLSKSTAAVSAVLVHLLKLFIPLQVNPTRLRPVESTSGRFEEIAEEEQTSEEHEDDQRRVIAVLFGEAQTSSTSGSSLSPNMARSLAIVLCTGSDLAVNVTSVEWALDVIISRWSSKERIRRASLSEEQFLTTFLLSVLAQCPTSDALAARTLMSADFINSIGSHIGHQNLAIRRLGMLVGELFEEAAKRSTSQDNSSSRRLDFGASTWNGRGEGREVARVLRAMVLGWSSSDPLRQELPRQQDELLRVIGLLDDPIQTLGVTLGKEADSPPSPIDRPPKSIRTLPSSRALPVRKSAGMNIIKQAHLTELVENTSSLSILAGGKARKSRPLISDITDAEVTDALGSTSSKTLRAYDLPDESDLDESSSSESDSDSDLGEEAMGSATSNKMGEDPPDLLDVQVLKKKQRRRPVYASELVPLLRSSERKDNRKGLKTSEELIRRKTGWGMEIEECAVELGLALAALQNNWSTRFFEERRTGALAALIVAAPRTACGCLVEQYFSGYYSIAQRMSILNAIVEAARELSEKNGSPTGLTAKADVGASAYVLVRNAASDARQYGEQKYGEVRQAAAVNILRAPQQALISESTGSVAKSAPATKNGRPVHVAPLAGARLSRLPRYVDIASSVFIFPLLNRFWALLQDASTRQSRMLGGSSRGSRATDVRQAPWQGAGLGSVLSAPAVGALLDALSVLSSLGRNALDFQRVIIPELLELSLVTPRLMFPLLGGSSSIAGGLDDSDDMMLIHQGALSLAVILIDAARSADSARFLKQEKAMLLDELAVYASEVFKAEQGKQQQGGGALMSRAGGASATLYLRLEEIQTS